MAKILVACEYSGAVRDAFLSRGHEALSCDLGPSDTEGPHYQGDVRDLLGGGWDMMIAFPPCTYLSSSGMHWTVRGLRDPKLTEDALEFVRVLLGAPIPRIALENPVGVISSRIRKPDQIIQPNSFGADASKRTCLWLKNLPPLTPTQEVPPRWVCCGEVIPSGDKYGCPYCGGDKVARPRWGNQRNCGQNKLSESDLRWRLRSKTYPGVAEAMAEQWGPHAAG